MPIPEPSPPPSQLCSICDLSLWNCSCEEDPNSEHESSSARIGTDLPSNLLSKVTVQRPAPAFVTASARDVKASQLRHAAPDNIYAKVLTVSYPTSSEERPDSKYQMQFRPTEQRVQSQRPADRGGIATPYTSRRTSQLLALQSDDSPPMESIELPETAAASLPTSNPNSQMDRKSAAIIQEFTPESRLEGRRTSDYSPMAYPTPPRSRFSGVRNSGPSSPPYLDDHSAARALDQVSEPAESSFSIHGEGQKIILTQSPAAEFIQKPETSSRYLSPAPLKPHPIEGAYSFLPQSLSNPFLASTPSAGLGDFARGLLPDQLSTETSPCLAIEPPKDVQKFKLRIFFRTSDKQIDLDIPYSSEILWALSVSGFFDLFSVSSRIPLRRLTALRGIAQFGNNQTQDIRKDACVSEWKRFKSRWDTFLRLEKRKDPDETEFEIWVESVDLGR